MILFRHGEAVGQHHKVLGRSPAPLTQLGRDKVREEARKIRGPYTRIISSPIRRAVETATIIRDVTGLPVDVDVRLTERDYGGCEVVSEIYNGIPDSKCFICKWYHIPDGGESLSSVYSRVATFLDKQDISDGVVVSHELILRFIHLIKNKKAPESYEAEEFKLGEIWRGHADSHGC